MFDGPLTAVPTGREVAVLAWLGRLVSGPSAR
jgi:hypothetical protein